MKYKVTPAIVCSKLEGKYGFHLGIGVRAKQILKNVVLYPTSSVRNPEYLYIDSYRSFISQDHLYKGCHVLLLDAPERYDRIDCGLIMLDSSVDAAGLYYAVLEIFSNFYDWIQDLHEMELQESNLPKVINSASEFLEMDLYLSNRDFEEEASTTGFRSGEPVLEELAKARQDEVCAWLNLQPDFEATFETRGVQTYPSPVGGMHYYYNIFDDNQFLVRLICLFPEKRYTQGCHQLVSYFCAFLERIYLKAYRAASAREQNTPFYEAIKKLLNGQFISREKLANTLAVYQWELNHSYQVIHLIPDQKLNNPYYRRYFIGQLEKHNPSCRVVELQNELVLVRNSSLESDMDQGEDQLRCFLRDNYCKAGMSTVSNAIEQLHTLHTQAKDALYIGSKKDEHYWYFHFENYAVEYMKDCCLKQYPKEALQHPTLRILREYDAQNNTNLFETLQIYVENRFSASSASEKMYLHRSTFMHRMERIKQLTNLNYEDQRERLRLQMSFFLE